MTPRRRGTNQPEQLPLPTPSSPKSRQRIKPAPEQAARIYIAKRANPSVVPGQVKLTIFGVPGARVEERTMNDDDKIVFFGWMRRTIQRDLEKAQSLVDARKGLRRVTWLLVIVTGVLAFAAVVQLTIKVLEFFGIIR